MIAVPLIGLNHFNTCHVTCSNPIPADVAPTILPALTLHESQDQDLPARVLRTALKLVFAEVLTRAHIWDAPFPGEL